MKSPTILRAANAGFSLIEFMVVVVIISILAGVVAISVLDKPDEAAAGASKAQIKNFETALKLYQQKFRSFPSTAQGLQALVKKPAGLSGDYPKAGFLDATKLPQDGWKRDFVYIAPGTDGQPYEVISYGADGEPGGEGLDADISSSDF